MPLEDDWKPNLFVPGFPKCASTSMYEYLRQHPDIYLLERKEPFTLLDKLYGWRMRKWALGDRDVERHRDRVLLSWQAYQRLFQEMSHKPVRGDCSTIYADWPDFVPKLKEFSPDAKVVMMIRNQTKRLVSSYLHFYENYECSFQEWIDRYLEPDLEGYLFLNSIEAYHQEFGNNLRVVDVSALKHPQELMDELFSFLDVEPIKVDRIEANVGAIKPEDEAEKLAALSKTKKLGHWTGHALDKVLRALNIRESRAVLKMERLSPANLMMDALSRRPTRKKKEQYREIAENIPNDLSKKLEEDYNDTLKFCRGKDILVETG